VNDKLELLTGIGIASSCIVSLFGGCDAILITLLIFMGVDYLTGLIVAGVFKNSKKSKTGTLESKAGWKGLLRKGATLMIVLVAVRMDVIIGTDFIRTMVIFAFMSNEVISILENTGLMGIPIPKVLTKAIDILQSRNESNDEQKLL